MSTVTDSTVVREYQTFIIASIVRKELGVKSFEDVENQLAEIKMMIDEMLAIAESNSSIPKGLTGQIYLYVEKFNEIARDLKKYNIDEDVNSSFNRRNTLILRINYLYNSIFHGIDENNKVNNFLLIYDSLKLYNLLQLQKDKEVIDKLKQQLNESNIRANEVLNLLQAKASAETVQDYSAIFQNQANKYSRFQVNFKQSQLHIGSAQVWLLISVILIVSFVLTVLNVNNILPVDFTQKASVVTIELLTRLVVISFAIYLVSFSFKQYNVQNHLYTINKHRQNTLDSFKLFIESLDTNDNVTRTTLMMEVAKAIYEAGHSGYISTKDGSDSAPSIIEMTRFVNQDK
jgi:hypothetical protein